MRKRAIGLLSVVLLFVLGLPSLTQAQAQVRVVVNRDFVNVRLYPAIGATVVGSANAGITFTANARTPDNEWLRIQFAGSEAWVGTVVVTILEGDINSLPHADPRYIPYGGENSPRAGFTEQTSDIIATLPDSGIRIRSGPSTAYQVIADAPRFSEMYLLGRTANNLWVQVNWEGNLGWVSVQYIVIQDNHNILELPVDGIVASQSPLNLEGDNELFVILRLMRERLDLAQPSLDAQRAVWTDAALGITPFCGGYPSRPSNFNTLPRDVYILYFSTIDPLISDFNEAMANVRNSIDLQIETCGRPGADVVLTSVPVVAGGLGFIEDADREFASLRRRIDELLPQIDENDCIFAFAGRVDILPIIQFSTVIEDEFEPDVYALGFCFDASPEQIGKVELLRRDTNTDIILSVSPLENPSNFLASGTGGPTQFESITSLNNILFPDTGRYLLLLGIRVDEDEIIRGEYALLLENIVGLDSTQTFLSFDSEGNAVVNTTTTTTTTTDTTSTTDDTTTTGPTATNNLSSDVNVYVTIDTSSGVVGTIAPGQTVPAPGKITGWIQVQLPDGTLGWVPDTVLTYNDPAASDGSDACPGLTLTCSELFDCNEVQACVTAGSTVLDPNGNGIACDSDEDVILSCTVIVP